MMNYLSRAQVREIDRRATAEYGIPSIVLMENAGRGCVELVMRLNPEKKPVLILCGPGNNGGDGFVIARHLDNHQWPVRVMLLEETKASCKDAVINNEIVKKIDLGMVRGRPYAPAWIIDALFGTGLSRPIDNSYARIFDMMNGGKVPVLAVDIPSGLDCNTGEPLGPCVKATHTATFVAPKLGFKNPNSKEYTGEVHVIDIGIPQKLIEDVLKASGAA